MLQKLCVSLTSPKAPLPIMVRRSKSSTQILCLLSRIYSVSVRSKSFNRLICSFSGTCSDANFFSSTERLEIIKSCEGDIKLNTEQELYCLIIANFTLVTTGKCITMNNCNKEQCKTLFNTRNLKSVPLWHACKNVGRRVPRLDFVSQI